MPIRTNIYYQTTIFVDGCKYTCCFPSGVINLTMPLQTPYDYFSKTAPNKMWKNIYARTDIPYRNVYQLCHTYASWILSYANVNIAYLAQQMGHNNFLMIANVYGKWMKNSNMSESEKAWVALKGIQS